MRKLLEDVHLESEETAALLRKKHQEVVNDFQEQLDQVAKAKARYRGRNLLSNHIPIYFAISIVNIFILQQGWKR